MREGAPPKTNHRATLLVPGDPRPSNMTTETFCKRLMSGWSPGGCVVEVEMTVGGLVRVGFKATVRKLL